MGRVLLLVVMALAVASLLWTATRWLGASAPGRPSARLRGDEVRFDFRPRRWTTATILGSRDTVPLRDLRVRRVSVALPGANGVLALTPMRRDEGTWRARVRGVAPAPGETLHYGFVVNDRFWAEPPVDASERGPFPGSPSRSGLLLTRPRSQ